MRNLTFLFILILFSGCVTQKRCLRKFPPQTVIERSDSIVMRDTIIYRDRVVEVVIEADTVFIEKILPIRVPIDLFVSPVEAENAYAKAKAWIENRQLKLQLTQKEQAIQRILKNAEVHTSYWKEKYVTEKSKETTIVYKAKPIHKAALWFSGIIILIFLLWVANKIKKFLPF